MTDHPELGDRSQVPIGVLLQCISLLGAFSVSSSTIYEEKTQNDSHLVYSALDTQQIPDSRCHDGISTLRMTPDLSLVQMTDRVVRIYFVFWLLRCILEFERSRNQRRGSEFF